MAINGTGVYGISRKKAGIRRTKSDYKSSACDENFASSYIMMCVVRLSYIFMWERNPSIVSLKMPSDSIVWVPMLVWMDVHT